MGKAVQLNDVERRERQRVEFGLRGGLPGDTADIVNASPFFLLEVKLAGKDGLLHASGFQKCRDLLVQRQPDADRAAGIHGERFALVVNQDVELAVHLEADVVFAGGEAFEDVVRFERRHALSREPPVVLSDIHEQRIFQRGGRARGVFAELDLQTGRIDETHVASPATVSGAFNSKFERCSTSRYSSPRVWPSRKPRYGTEPRRKMIG